ncbi:hypothetical protein B0A53_00268 [Rhodotorula sp. CCFEE 5036]|nr:hypothetical protein B0A53_00268 [Rhodotorula sp. CCFEE 5036]
MPPDRRPSLAGSISSPTGGHHAADVHSNGAAGQEDDHSASPSAEPEGSKGKRKHTRGIGRGRACLTCRKRKVNKKDGAPSPSRSWPDTSRSQVTAFSRNAESVYRPQYASDNPSLVVCDFPSEEERRKPVGGGKVYALEAKIQTLERKLAEAEARAEANAQSAAVAAQGPHPPMLPFPQQLDLDQPRPHTATTTGATGTQGPSVERTPRPRHASAGGQAFYDPATADALGPRFPFASDNGSLGSPFGAFGFESTSQGPPFRADSTLASGNGGFPPFAAHPHNPPVSAAPPPPFSHPGSHIMSSQFVTSPTYAPMGGPPPIADASSSSGPPRPAPFSDPPQLLPAPAHMSNDLTAPAAAILPSGPRLPSYTTLSRLVNIFFDYPHEAIDLINRRRFTAAFAHPPDHPEYPAECLLHAMVATATDLAGLDAWEGEARYWTEGQSPAVFHADLAEYLLPLGFRTERNLLQVAQAAVLFACLNLYHGRFSRAYIDTSIAVRICTSLGLNHNVFLPNHLPLSSFLAHRTALPPPQDEEEARERSVTWWFAYTVETFSAAATGWACCIDERDITTLVPAAGPVGDDPLAREALYLHSPSFFVTNPPHLVRLVQINLKVTVLLNRVCTFVSRTTALANATPERSALHPSEFPKIRSSPAFTKLEAALENFGRKAPAQLVALLEPEAFLCPSLVATSVIILHERFCTSEHNDPSMLKCLEAANSILQNMQVLNNASFHPRQIPPFLSFCWTVAARTYLRQMAIRQFKGMPPTYPPSSGHPGMASSPTLEDEVRHLTQIVTSIIARLEHFRTPVGPLMAASLVSLLDRPDICLPECDRVKVDPTGQTALANLTSVMSNIAPAAVNV